MCTTQEIERSRHDRCALKVNLRTSFGWGAASWFFCAAVACVLVVPSCVRKKKPTARALVLRATSYRVNFCARSTTQRRNESLHYGGLGTVSPPEGMFFGLCGSCSDLCVCSFIVRCFSLRDKPGCRHDFKDRSRAVLAAFSCKCQKLLFRVVALSTLLGAGGR